MKSFPAEYRECQKCQLANEIMDVMDEDCRTTDLPHLRSWENNIQEALSYGVRVHPRILLGNAVAHVSALDSSLRSRSSYIRRPASQPCLEPTRHCYLCIALLHTILQPDRSHYMVETCSASAVEQGLCTRWRRRISAPVLFSC